jgi:hypothetical protein
MFIVMTKPTSRLPTLVTVASGIFIFEVFLFVTIFGQVSPPADPVTATQSWFAWIVAAAGFITLAIGIGYGFFKKTKYQNIKTDRDEWKGLAETREARIKELKIESADQKTRLELKVAETKLELEHEADLNRNLVSGNKAMVIDYLQMKAILKKLRLDGVWHGDEDNIHRTQ